MRHERGFTLLELMCVLAILSVLASAGVTLLVKSEGKSHNKEILMGHVSTLTTGLQEARQLAIDSGDISHVCGGENCTGVWSNGFSVLQSESLGGVYREVLFDHEVRIVWQGFPANKAQVSFLSNGLSSYQNGTFEFCYRQWQANVVINQSGRFYTTDAVEVEACE